MIRQSFNDGWMVKKNPWNRKEDNQGEYVFQPVTLPHDAMISERRDPGNPSGTAGAYYPGFNYTYVKKFFVPEDCAGKSVSLEFEGVQQSCLVSVNGQSAGSCHYGYTCFAVDIACGSARRTPSPCGSAAAASPPPGGTPARGSTAPSPCWWAERSTLPAMACGSPRRTWRRTCPPCARSSA